MFTRLLKERGLKCDNSLQNIGDVTVYPMEYFNPIGEDITAAPVVTENTRTIHWYQASWYEPLDAVLFKMRKKYGYKKGTVFFSLRHPIAAMKRRKNKSKNKIEV